MTQSGQAALTRTSLEDGKVAQMGIFIPGRLGMDEGENVLSMVITGDYSGFMLFFFASGKCAKIPLSSYATKQNRRKLLKAYCDKEPLATLLFLPEETELAIRTSASRMLPQVTRVYACITYGSKSIPVVTLTALTCAEATHTELEVGGVYYGEVKRENGRVLSARLYDMAALYQLSGLVGTMRDSRTAEQVFHQLIWMNERRED